jgi:TonB family protein
MASSRIALIVLITLFTAGAAFSQEGQNEAPTPQSPVPNSSTPKPKRIRVGGAVASANLIHRVAPVYPKEAKKKHITGAVLLHATIGKDGTIENLEYVSGPPELTPSAMEAVKQWRYKPTLLRGEPIEVDTTISVVYTLGREDPNGATGSNSPSDVSDSPASQHAEKEAAATSSSGGSSEPNSSTPKLTREGHVTAATLVYQVTPLYPEDAKKKHVQGTVLLNVTIEKDGSVENLVYESGPPMLMSSAIEAVKKWRYKPTILNGEPVAVNTTISVTYELNNH